MKWIRQNWSLLILLVITSFLFRTLFPKTITVGRNIPVIVTKYDTITTQWRDTVYKTTTDTFNLVVRQTIHDTIVINVGSDTLARPRLWPIISYWSQKKDSATIRTFDLRSGHGAESFIYVPGPLLGIIADSTPTPHLQYGEWPQFHTSKLTKIFYTGVGYGICALANRVH